MMKANRQDSFWSKVEYGPDCWIWNAAKNRKGYGQFRVDGKLWISHRLVWTLAHGEIPKGMHVLHTTCDNPSCVRPDHLSIGTNQDNVDDKMRKKRHWTFTRTACKAGHAYTSETVRIRPCDGSRVCKLCKRLLQRLKYSPEARAARYACRKEGG